jgi:transmembrane serine protease 9
LSSSSGLSLIGVRVGDHDISKERDCDVDKMGFEVLCIERYQDFGVESIHYHPQYTRSKLQNDIALIRVNSDIDFRPQNVKPICLPVDAAAGLTSKRVRVHVPSSFRLATRKDHDSSRNYKILRTISSIIMK